MPCATVHMLVAREALARWTESPHPDFAIGESTRAAFLHGSMAPDVGFIPGVDRFVSELAHYHRPADLCRALMDRAHTQEAKAFVWGWIAHVLCDVALHPMVGRAVGELVQGDRSLRMDAEDNLLAHVATEVGLDVALIERHADLPCPPPDPYFSSQTVGMLAEALEDVYGFGWDSGQLLRDHRVAVARTRRWPLLLRTVRSLTRAWRSTFAAPLAVLILAPLRWGSPADSAFRGVLEARRPAPWLVDSVEHGAANIARSLDRLAHGGLQGLENRNLETGQLQTDDDPHGGAVAVRARISELRGSEVRGSKSLLSTTGGDHDGTPVVTGSEAGSGVASVHELHALHVRNADRVQ